MSSQCPVLDVKGKILINGAEMAKIVENGPLNDPILNDSEAKTGANIDTVDPRGTLGDQIPTESISIGSNEVCSIVDVKCDENGAKTADFEEIGPILDRIFGGSVGEIGQNEVSTSLSEEMFVRDPTMQNQVQMGEMGSFAEVNTGFSQKTAISEQFSPNMSNLKPILEGGSGKFGDI